MVGISTPLKKAEETDLGSLFQEPVFNQHERRLEMKQELNNECISRPTYPPCPALSFSPDDGSLASTLTASTTKSTPDVADDEDIFSFPEDVVAKMNDAHPGNIPQGFAPDKNFAIPSLPFEETMDNVFFRILDAILGDEAMMKACQDPMLGKPILDDVLSTNGELEGMIVPQKIYGDEDPTFRDFDGELLNSPTWQTMFINNETDFVPNSGGGLPSETINFFPEHIRQDTTTPLCRETISLFHTFQSSSLSVEGFSPSIKLDVAKDESCLNRDDSSAMTKSWGRLYQAVNAAARDDSATESQRVEASMSLEDFETELFSGSSDELVFINRHDFEPQDESKAVFLSQQEEIVFENKNFQREERYPQESRNSMKKSRRPLGLRFLFGSRLRRRLSRFSWNMKQKRDGMQGSKDNPSHSQSSPGTVATTAFTIPSDSDTIQDLSLPTSTRRSEAYDEQDSYSDHHDYHQFTVISIQ